MNGESSRRDFLALTGTALAGAAALEAYQAPKKLYAYVSSQTKGPFGVGGGGGISVFTVNMNDGSLTQVSRTGQDFDGLNGGNLCISANGRFLYCTHEAPTLNGKAGSGGGVHAFSINRENGALTYLNTQLSMGVNPCFIIIDPTGSRVVVANHGDLAKAVTVVKRNGVPVIEDVTDDGTVALFPVKPDGSLEPACDVAVFEKRPITNPGAGAAAHSVNFDRTGRFIVSCDVGANHIYVFPFDPSSRTLVGKSYPTPGDKAPRHSVFHPRAPYFFITNEREASLSSFHFDSMTGEVRFVQTVPTIPAGYSGPRVSPADIRMHPNGKFVYGSNRGDDSIAIMKIDEATGQMSPVDIVKTGGANPREFGFEPSGKYLFIGNLQDNHVATFVVDPDTGKMTPTGVKAEVFKPACIHFVAL